MEKENKFVKPKVAASINATDIKSLDEQQTSLNQANQDESIIIKRSRIDGIKKFANKLGLNYFIIFLVIFVVALTSILGLILHGIYTTLRGPIYLQNQYIGLWLASLVLFFSLQAFYLLFKSDRFIRNKFFFSDLFYFSLCLPMTIIIIICYGISRKTEGIMWGLILLGVNSTNVYVLISRRKISTSQTNIQDDKKNLNENKSSSSNGKIKFKNCSIEALKIINIILKGIFLLFLGLLTAGSVIIGGYLITYPPRGKFVTVPLNDGSGRSITLHYLCDGPKNDSFPVYMFEGSFSHGYMDFYGLQTILKEQNRRSCIWDKAGLGYSDYMYPDMYDNFAYYHNFIKAIGEKSPFIFVAWGGGGSIAFKYAYENPTMVYSITLLDTSPPQVEWTIPKILKNWTNDQYDANVKQDMASRFNLIDIINGLGVPWGLMSVFIPPSKAYPIETRNEVNWFFLSDKTWTTQKYYLPQLPNEENVFSKYKIATNITIYHIMTVKDDSQVRNLTCTVRKLSDSDCQYEIKSNELSIQLRRNLYSFNKIVNCTSNDCDLAYYVYNGPQFTVSTLMNLYANVSI